MSGSTILLPLLLLLSGSSASHFNGGTMTFNPKGVNANGSYTVDIRFKLALHSTCSTSAWANMWNCQSGNCGSISSNALYNLDSSSGDWCQWEEVMIRNVDTNLPFILELSGGNWITTYVGGIAWRLRTTVDLGVRSDTGTANRSPQTTVIPLLLVPVNCPRDFQLLAHDPDGDLVQCRLGLSGNQECADCSLPVPSIFTLKSPCTLSYWNTSSVPNTYAVQLMMEDFPTASITLSYKDGTQSNRSSLFSPLSKLPVQFAVRVGAAVPSCAEGEYLPRFLSPTPAYGTHLYVAVNNTLEISVRAEALYSNVSELLVSGPHNFTKTTTAPGQFTIRWTPTANDDRQDHPICFVSQALNNVSSKIHSELRCVIVTVGNLYTTPDPETTTNIFTTNTTTIPDATNTTPPPTTTTPTNTTTIVGVSENQKKAGVPC
ncbi:uncharacterized protein LOC134013530 [Osmerus eperlanus]|uniref:uncharacterized protein LOC134013530 n=1 Tax=Osmerus eperlanus TaxID=29151 RepID=UPI002E15DCDC